MYYLICIINSLFICSFISLLMCCRKQFNKAQEGGGGGGGYKCSNLFKDITLVMILFTTL